MPLSNLSSIEMIERLVAIDTTSAKSNLDLIDVARRHLDALGASCRLTFDDTRRKANLYAVLGPADTPGVMLSGHTDVVPADPWNWSGDPFRLTRRGDDLYGRGCADMKSFLGVALAMAPEFSARGLEIPLHFSLSYDEELGCLGVHRLIADLAGLAVKPRLGIVGEPTGMRLVAGHKGKRSFSCHVRGTEGHSSLGEGVNAIEAAAELVAMIGRLRRRVAKEGPFDDAYAPPTTTLHLGTIHGGEALNVMPRDCVLAFEIRALPGFDPGVVEREIREYARDVIEPDMKRIQGECGFSFAIETDYAGFDLPDDHEAVRFIASLLDDKTTGRVSFGTEAGLFNQAGVPTAVCGPGFIAQAHRPNEFISLDQIGRAEAFMRRLMDRICF